MKILTLATTVETRTRQLLLAVCFTLLLVIPATIHQQAVTGPLVNALLLLSFLLFGRAKAFFFALLPSSMALAAGLLPLPLSPMLPFIMISNCLYIATFAHLFQPSVKVAIKAILFAALVKAAFLLGILTYLISPLLPATLTQEMFFMMSFAQLWTAVAGGFLALGIYQVMGKYVDRSIFTRRD